MRVGALGACGFVGEVLDELQRSRNPEEKGGGAGDGNLGEYCVGYGVSSGVDEVSGGFSCVDSVQRGSEGGASWRSAEPVCSCDGDYVVLLFFRSPRQSLLLYPDRDRLWEHAAGSPPLWRHHVFRCFRVPPRLVRVLGA